jgi:RNA polymerase sigma-70 factor, ECF subfamily
MNATFTTVRLQTAVAGAICNSALGATSPAFSSLVNAARSTFLFSPVMADDRKTLIEGLRQRDPELLDRLIEEYQHRLYRYLVYLTSDAARAEDFFQETWIRILERGHQYDGRHKFEAWLFTIARNLVIDWQRQKKAISLDSMVDPEEEGRPIDLPDEKAESPLYLYLQGESEHQVQASLDRLPVPYREVLLLRFREEMQLDEIARIQ